MKEIQIAVCTECINVDYYALILVLMDMKVVWDTRGRKDPHIYPSNYSKWHLPWTLMHISWCLPSSDERQTVNYPPSTKLLCKHGHSECIKRGIYLNIPVHLACFVEMIEALHRQKQRKRGKYSWEQLSFRSDSWMITNSHSSHSSGLLIGLSQRRATWPNSAHSSGWFLPMLSLRHKHITWGTDV